MSGPFRNAPVPIGEAAGNVGLDVAEKMERFAKRARKQGRMVAAMEMEKRAAELRELAAEMRPGANQQAAE